MIKLELKLKKIEWIENETEDAIIKDYLKQRAISLNDLPQIPENKFVKYKHWHVRKVEWSQFVDTHRAAPWYWLKLLFFLKGIGIYDNPKKRRTPMKKKDHPENDDLKHSPQL